MATVGPVRTTAAAALSTIVTVMPAFLIGASGVFVRTELGFGTRGLGLAVAAFMGATALTSTAGGRFAEHIGGGRALMVAAAASALVMVGIGTLAYDLARLVIFLVVGGVANGIAGPAGNLALARGVIVRPALMFGVKQSAIPLATMLAGASVPLVSLTLGWRWAFIAGGGLALVTVMFVPHRLASPQGRTRAHIRDGDAATAPLVALAVATGVGTAAAVSFGAFLVESAVAADVAAGTAGWLLSAGSIAGVLARLGAGWAADRFHGRALFLVAGMLAVGAVGYVMLSLDGLVLLAVGTLLAYGCGWGWTGLLMFATVRLNPNAPAAATGIIHTGAAAGAALGPLIFGGIVAASSFPTAWRAMAGAALLSAGLTLAARSWLLRDRDHRHESR